MCLTRTVEERGFQLLKLTIKSQTAIWPYSSPLKNCDNFSRKSPRKKEKKEGRGRVGKVILSRKFTLGKRQSACIVHRLEAKSILRCRAAAARRKSPAVWGDSVDPILKVRCSFYTGAQRVHKAPNSHRVHWIKPHPLVRAAISHGHKGIRESLVR